MKMYLISDNLDTLTGMRLAGVDGIVVHERDELKETIEKAMSDPEIGIVLLTEKFGREFPELIDEIKLERKMPLLIEILTGTELDGRKILSRLMSMRRLD